MHAFLESLLNIPSPTYEEGPFTTQLKKWMTAHLPPHTIQEHNNSIICTFKKNKDNPTLALVGHSDVVPAFFTPYTKENRLYGAGASDMKGGLAAFWYLMAQEGLEILKKWNITLICYAREENTPLTENGLYDLIQHYPDILKKIDLAIVGEPTNVTVQLGCVGSIHAKVTVKGQACHSARPWNGENALYKALPLIQFFSQLTPIEREIHGVKFYDVMSITESESEKGRTSIPGLWTANINYRFAPTQSLESAIETLKKTIETLHIPDLTLEIMDSVEAGAVIKTPLSDTIISQLDLPIEAKQAWTDVAQLTAMGIPAFNFGPGQTHQAHKKDEYIELNELNRYYAALKNMILNVKL